MQYYVIDGSSHSTRNFFFASLCILWDDFYDSTRQSPAIPHCVFFFLFFFFFFFFFKLLFTQTKKRSPSDFLKSVLGRPVKVKLNSGIEYRGVLACLDGYLNIAMEQTEEYVNGELKAKYGDCFIRGNNGTCWHVCVEWSVHECFLCLNFIHFHSFTLCLFRCSNIVQFSLYQRCRNEDKWKPWPSTFWRLLRPTQI
jgi:U6 snRNA-associated Sm-like protein LSm6